MKIEIKESTEFKKPNYPYLAKTPHNAYVIVSEDGYRLVKRIDVLYPFGENWYNQLELTPLPSGSQVILTQE